MVLHSVYFSPLIQQHHHQRIIPDVSCYVKRHLQIKPGLDTDFRLMQKVMTAYEVHVGAVVEEVLCALSIASRNGSHETCWPATCKVSRLVTPLVETWKQYIV
ncbi:hypothetical protein ACMYSQ_003693 [Aspergillus niger]